jgi:competence ComEA-like helix-hairpin-helix protein
MKNNKEHQLLVFSAAERRGIFLLLILNLLVLMAPVVYWNYFSINKDKALLSIDSLPKNFLLPASDSNFSASNQKKVPVELFFFDPNTASEKQWQKLGLSKKAIQTIQHYQEKGGKFYKPKDIKKIWGISLSLAEQLIPYVRIDDKNNFQNKAYSPPSSKKPTQQIIEINTADSAAFEKLYGIGPALASRIVKYRSKLGGFYSIQQIAEVWGLADSVFIKIQKQLMLTDKTWVRFNLNKVDYEQLKSHPYFGYSVARAIIRYRDQHGGFPALEDVQRILSIDDEKYNKIVHYLKVE